jgi:peptidoglycan/LPS O-acetylase OafA/YrhL
MHPASRARAPAGASSARIGELDALRGLAAIAVMIFHYTALYAKDVGHLNPPPFQLAAGNYGVQLFFVISGFVIFMTLERTRSAADFVVSRFTRLYPTYWAALALSALFIYTIGLPSQRISPLDAAANLTMLQELFHFRHLDGSYWTLQIELLFYAQMLFWYMIGQFRRPHWIIAGWLLIALVYHVTALKGVNLSWTLSELLIVRHIPFFSLGILFYKLYTEPADHRKSRLNHLMVAACVIVIAITREPVYLPVALTCVAVFYLFMYGKLRWLQAAPFAFFGTISYSLYLLHQAIGFDIIWHLEHDLGSTSALAITVAITVSTTLAIVVTFCVERPTMRWLRTRWQAHRAITPEASGT